MTAAELIAYCTVYADSIFVREAGATVQLSALPLPSALAWVCRWHLRGVVPARLGEGIGVPNAHPFIEAPDEDLCFACRGTPDDPIHRPRVA